MRRADADFLRREAEKRLIERIEDIRRTFARSLVIGDVAGRLRASLVERYPGILIVGMDDAPPSNAGQPWLEVSGDGGMPPFAPESFDAILSVFDLHAVDDLPGALAQYRAMLRPDGLLLATFPGGDTLMELRWAMMQAELATRQGAAARVVPFVDVRDAGALLQRAGFALPVADVERLELTYADVGALVGEIRGLGEANPLIESHGRPLGRDTLARMIEIYASTFTNERGRFTATLDLLTITGWRPDPSQQQPLQPGSATAKLADELGRVGNDRGQGGG